MTMEDSPPSSRSSGARSSETSVSVTSAAELARLKKLVGPDEQAYEDLRLEIWRLRDEVVGLEQACGTLTAKLTSVEDDLMSLRESAHHMFLDRNAIRSSVSYRVGRVVTAPARMLRKVLRKLARR